MLIKSSGLTTAWGHCFWCYCRQEEGLIGIARGLWLCTSCHWVLHSQAFSLLVPRSSCGRHLVGLWCIGLLLLDWTLAIGCLVLDAWYWTLCIGLFVLDSRSYWTLGTLDSCYCSFCPWLAIVPLVVSGYAHHVIGLTTSRRLHCWCHHHQGGDVRAQVPCSARLACCGVFCFFFIYFYLFFIVGAGAFVVWWSQQGKFDMFGISCIDWLCWHLSIEDRKPAQPYPQPYPDQVEAGGSQVRLAFLLLG